MALKLLLLSFITGAAVMIFELLGSRVMAPFFGTSIIVWTNLIGVIMGSLSIGYWWGGSIADKRMNRRTLPTIIFAAGMLIGLVSLVEQPFLVLITRLINDHRLGALVGSIGLFTAPNILLGMVSPLIAKQLLLDQDSTGATVGRLYAVSTAGSIFGTFLAGLVLVAYFGTKNLLVGISAVLAIASFSFLPMKRVKPKAVIVLTVLLCSIYSTLLLLNIGGASIDTAYARYLIIDATDKITDRPVRLLQADPGLYESAIYLDKNDDLVFDYTKMYRLSDELKSEQKKTLLIGGGVYTYPQDFLRRHPESRMDVVEIDPKLLPIAKEYFGYQEDSRINIVAEDGRTYLNRNREKYDVIFVDAFKSYYSIPYQLTTKEAIQRLADGLSDNGVVLVNTISSVTNLENNFLGTTR